MVAQDIHNVGLAWQQIEVVVLEEPAKGITVGITLKLDAACKLVGRDDQSTPSNLHIQFSFREVQTTLNIGKGVRAGQDFARLLSECGEEV